MKKQILAIISLALILIMGLSACGGTKLTMGTGGTGGTYYAFGGVLSQYISKNVGVNCTAVSTDGSKANIQGVDAGDYQLATVQSDVMAYAWNGTNTFAEDGKVDGFRVIGGLYAECVQIITTDPSIKSVADLKGKTVSIGAPGSGVYFNAIDVLTAAGLTEDDINAQYQSFNDSAESLKDGTIDAGFIVAGPPTPAITQLAASAKAYLVPVDGAVAEKVMANCPYYTAYTIPAGTYDGQDKDVQTVAVKATMIISADVDDETAYQITKAIFDNTEAITAEYAKGSELSIENATTGMTAPFHTGAARYFAEKGVTVESK
ncbi:MAG: TAXI family TRAP transporter solute-binding subunit [Clostridia bacterium]|nr:TAXI family TRAP transporter solute-binding subunit [Clostridia bacterium]